MENNYVKIWNNQKPMVLLLTGEEFKDVIIKIFDEIDTGVPVDYESLNPMQKMFLTAIKSNEIAARKSYNAEKQRRYRDRKNGDTNSQPEEKKDDTNSQPEEKKIPTPENPMKPKKKTLFEMTVEEQNAYFQKKLERKEAEARRIRDLERQQEELKRQEELKGGIANECN